MSVSGLFNIGITAMQTTNQLLDITSHNIANANTPGYTRQDAIVQSIASGLITTTGATGNGVQIADIQRMYNAFVNNQLNTENSNLSYWNNYQTGITQVEDVFNEASTTGISPAITQFFTDWQKLAQNPQDSAQRTTLMQDASYLSSRLNTASASLQNERSQLLSDSQSLAKQVNADTAQIADLNAKIAGNPGSLDLQDQRDYLVQQLNQIIKVSSYQNTGGSVNLLVGGTPLVEGPNAYNLSANSDTSNNMHFYVSIVPGAAQGSDGNPDVTSSVTGGQLKANLDLRDTAIPAYLNKLNAFAIDLADTTNYYQKQGYGLDGSPGGNFFQSPSLQAKYTSVDSVNGVFTSQTNTFSTNGGTLKIKLGDNDATPATVTVAAGATLNDIVNDINTQAGSKMTATVVDLDPSGGHDYRISIKSGGNLRDVRISALNAAGNGPSLDGTGSGLNLLATGSIISSMNVTDPTSMVSNAQYKIDYVNGATYGSLAPTVQAGYQLENTNDLYTIDNTNNKIQMNGATVTIPTGSYTGAGLAKALEGVLTNPPNLNGSATATVTYNSATGKFTVDNPAAYTVDQYNNTVNFTDGAANYTVNIGNNALGTAAGLEGVLNTALSSVDGGKVTASYAAGKITLNTTSANAVTINWNNSSATSQMFGLGATVGAGNVTTIPAGGSTAAGIDITGAGFVPAALTNINWNIANTAANMFGFLKTDPLTTVGLGSTLTSDYGISGSYWRVMKSTDGSTWTAINPNATYNQSNPSTVNQTEVNLTTDTTGSFSRTLEFDGVKVRIDGDLNQANSNGDTFAVQLDPNAAGNIKTAITDPKQVAASTDMFTVDSTNNTVVFNVNGGANITATIPAGSYASDDISSALTTAIQTAYQNATGSALPDTLNAVFNPNTKQFKVVMPSGSDTINLLWSSNSASTAKQIFGFSKDATVTAGQSAVSDNPASVLSSANKGVPGDNRNATTIGNLANGTLFAGTTPVDFYNSLVSDVGVKAASAKNSQQYESNMVDQLTQRRSEVSGVSMDQEAANLVIYQKAYQAAAQMITVANTLLTSLMQMVSSGTAG